MRALLMTTVNWVYCYHGSRLRKQSDELARDDPCRGNEDIDCTQKRQEKDFTMKPYFVIILALALLLASCAPSQPPATATFTPAPPTNTHEPTATPPPTAMASPTPEQPTALPTIVPPDPAAVGLVPPPQVTLALPPFIAASRVELSPGAAYDPNIPPELNGFPPNLLVAFDDEGVASTAFNINEQQIRVFPAQAFLDMYAQANNPEVAVRIQELARLLGERPQEVTNPIPVLPGIGAVQTLRARVKYIDFSGGTGVAFLAAYKQGPAPLTNEDLTYFFQGLSSDGRWYISMAYPVNSARLPATAAEVPPEAAQLAQQDYAAYLAQTTQLLDQAAANEFTPDLEALNAMLASLNLSAPSAASPTPPVTVVPTQPGVAPTAPALPTQPATRPTVTAVLPTPQPGPTRTPTLSSLHSELIGANWYLVTFIKSNGDEVDFEDGDRYFFQLKADGTVVVKSDCNSASGVYTVRSHRLTIDIRSGTDKDCGSGSISELFTNTLDNSHTFDINNNRLELRVSDGSYLRFSK